MGMGNYPVPVSIVADTGNWELVICTLTHLHILKGPAALSTEETERRRHGVFHFLRVSHPPKSPCLRKQPCGGGAGLSASRDHGSPAIGCASVSAARPCWSVVDTDMGWRLTTDFHGRASLTLAQIKKLCVLCALCILCVKINPAPFQKY